MRKTLFFFLLLIISAYSLVAQTNVFKGYVRDSLTLEPLIGATIYSSSSAIGVATNEYGYFVINVDSETDYLTVSYVGYGKIALQLTPNTINTILLSPSVEIKEVVITGKGIRYEPLLAKYTLTQQSLNSVPVIGGEKDLIKSLYVLPGVSGANEGASNLVVRGGNTDQNLFLIDDAPIYNTGHFYNLVSVYNTDAIKKVDFYNTVFPAKYGSTLSSIVDVSLKEGNKNRHAGSYDIGILSSKLLLEGPIGKSKKLSYIVSARSSYLDILKMRQKDLYDKHASDSYFGYTFFDVSGKVNYEINPNHKVFISGYHGVDYERTFYRQDNSKEYAIINNSAWSAKSVHTLSSRLQLNTGVHFTSNSFSKRQRFDVMENITSIGNFEYKQFNQLQDLQFKTSMNWVQSPRNTLRFGIAASAKEFSPFKMSVYEENKILKAESYKSSKEPTIKSVETALFVDNEFLLTNSIKLLPGLRFTRYTTNGLSLNALEPRLALLFNIDSLKSLTISYNRTTQFSHALIRNDGIKQNVVWVTSTNKIKPQNGNQYTISFSGESPSVDFEYGLTGYYRDMNNLLWYPFNTNTEFESDIYPYANWEQKASAKGKGYAYGVEVLLKKGFAKTSMAITYSWSRSYRQFSNVNSGEFYPSQFDRPHRLLVSAEHQFNAKWRISALWELRSGSRINLPVSQVGHNPYTGTYYLYPTLFTSKLPLYHRLDFAVSYQKFLPEGKSITYNFGIYNAYNRHNPYGVEIETEDIKDQNGNVLGYKTITKTVSIFPIIPSFNISYKF